MLVHIFSLFPITLPIQLWLCSNITEVPRQMIQSPLIRARIYSNLCYYQQVSLPL